MDLAGAGLPSEASEAQAKEELQLQIQAAQEARLLLCNPVLDQWFRDSCDSFLSKLDDVPLSDREGRQRIVDMLWLIGRLKQYLELCVDTGKTAKETLDELLELEKPKLRLGGLL